METAITLDPMVGAFIVGTLIPILVGVVTKLEAPRQVKAVANALLSSIAGALVSIIESGGTFVPKEVIFAIAVTWVTSVATYYGLIKPSGTSEKVQQSTASFGVGRARSA